MVALAASQALKGSMINSEDNNKEEQEVRHLETYLTSLKSFSAELKVAIDNEEVQVVPLQKVKTSSSKSKSISWKPSTARKNKFHSEELIFAEPVKAANQNQVRVNLNVELVEALDSNL